ncbi:MAG: hypothetical protein LBH21_06305, partial [Gracilibacteraceae bacterium]|nr:hypothetical protein [Gracilibacteraceae bacterium]
MGGLSRLSVLDGPGGLSGGSAAGPAVETASAKINLALAVGKPRPDGYHALQTVMQTVSLADKVKVTPLPGVKEIRCRCVRAGAGADTGADRAAEMGAAADMDELSGPDNLAVTAARSFEEELSRAAGRGLPFGLDIYIEKNIPVRAGLGGGSADAAAVLRAVNRLAGAPLGWAALEAAARRCGSDAPFCLRGGTQWAEGTGTTLRPLPPPPPLPVVVVSPAAGVSTAEA